MLCLSALVTENLNLAVSPKNLPAFQEMLSSTSPIVQKPLPNFENGGVVLFNHVAKTGGTTIRETFSGLQNVEWQFVGGLDDLLKYSKEVDDRLTNKINDKKILFLELHGPVPGMFTLHDFLDRWHAIAEDNNVPFFAFTMVRDPVAYSVSFFNFILAEPCIFNGCPYRTYPATEENLIETVQPNYQCMYLARDVTWFDFIENQTIPPLATDYECNAVYNVMRLDMDWVGLTDKLSTETVPLLKQMLLVDDKEESSSSSPSSKQQVFNDVQKSKPKTVKTSELHPTTSEYIRSISALDQSLYDRASKDYPLEMWQDFSLAADDSAR